MSSFLRKFFASSETSHKSKTREPQSLSSVKDEAKRKKLSRRLALAQTDPEPVLDLSDLELLKLDENVLSLIKVYHKHKLHLERNRLTTFVSTSHFVNVTVIHLEDNQITCFQAEESLNNLKELYLGSNRITNGLVNLRLPKLKVLSLRSNLIADFPLDLVFNLPELVYFDVAYNRIETLPAELCCVKNEIETLILEGNPLTKPEWNNLDQQNGFVDIVVALRKFYNLQLEESVGDMNTTCEQKCAQDLDEENDEHDVEAVDLIRRIEQRKIQTKLNILEWERSQQLQHEERNKQARETASTNSNQCMANKDKLLGELCDQQRGLMEKIDHLHSKKLADRHKRLEEYIAQVEEHSSRLIDKLSNDSLLTIRARPENGEEDELNADIRHLLQLHDEQARDKRHGLLDHLQESDKVAHQKLNESFQLKDSVHSELTQQLQRQDEELATMFDHLLSIRDRKNMDLLEKITLVEQELLALTFCERERRELESDARRCELDRQRAQLASLLASLLEVKRAREKMLKQAMQSQVFQRLRPNANENEQNWLEQVQRFLARESFEVQVSHHGLDARLATILIKLYHDLDQESLRTKLVYYLAHFVDVPYETLVACSASDFMSKCTIHDYELCQVIASRFQQVFFETKNAPSAPDEEIGKTIEQKIIEDNREKVETRQGKQYWHEVECVICLVNQPSIVFLPCGHICTCQACIRPHAALLSECPLCRTDIHFMQSIKAL